MDLLECVTTGIGFRVKESRVQGQGFRFRAMGSGFRVNFIGF
jgi:hypothetical protein